MRTHARGPVVRLLTAVLATALALVGLVALTTATAPVAGAATTGISGKVTAVGTGTPLAGMSVVLFCNEDGDWYWCQETTSGAGGAYAFDLPAGGSYHVGAYSEDNHYAAAFFGGTDEVNAADVVPPATGVDLAMTQNAAITGKATQGLLGTNAVEGADVCLYEHFTYAGQSWWDCINGTQTAADGTYTLWVEPGTYRVGFSTEDNRLREVYYSNAATVEAATDVVVDAGGKSGVNVKMVANAKVTGKVTAQETGSGIAGASVSAYQLVQAGPDSAWEWTHATTALADGSYTLYLAPGTYRIGFEGPCSDDGGCSATYRAEFWDDKPTVETAADVAVGNGGTVGNKNAALALNPKITGTVTEQDGGAPVAGAQVTALEKVTEEYDGETYTYWSDVAWATAGADGSYVLPVPPGTYRVSFDDACAETCDDIFQTEFWQEAGTIEAGKDVTLSGTLTLSDRNGTLAKNGKITGTVTAEAGGAPLAGVEVVALDQVTDGGETYWSPVGFATTDETGAYTLHAPPGSHRIGFSEGCWGASCRYLPEYYDDAATPEAGTPVTVDGPDTTTADIDAALAEGSLISGKLTDNADQPVSDAFVTVYAEDGGDWTEVSSTWSEGDGTYAALVPDGSFRVGFHSWDGTFTDEYYDDSFTLAGADAVVVAGADRPHVDAKLGLSLLNVTAPTVADADPKVGETITAGTGTWSATPDAFTYRWFQAGSTDPIGTAKDLVVPAGALGKQLTVEVTAKKAGYADGVATSAASVAVAPGMLTSTAKPTISGSVAVGSTLTALEGTWSATPDSFTYRWFQAGSTDPIGTAKDLVVPAGAVGKALAVEVTATKAAYADGVAFSQATAAVAPGALASTAKPTITGTAKVGETVTAENGTWSPTPDGYTYRWFQSGSTDPIGTAKDLVVPAGAAGKTLTVEVTATKPGYANSAVTSDPTAAVALGELTNTAKPTITGVVAVGGTVEAQPGTWSPTPNGYLYQWFVSGSTDPIATGKTLVVPASAAGKTLTVEVAAVKGGYAPAAVKSDPSAPVADGVLANTAKPTITGTAKVGATVTAGDGSWAEQPTGHTYRWFRSGSTDPIGTGKTLVVPAEAAGKTLTVEVTATAPGRIGVATSDPTAAVLPGDLANTAKPTITGTPKAGETVSAGNGTWAPAPDGYSYRWFRSGSTDPIGTTKDLVVPGAAAGQTLTVEVTATKSGYAATTRTSDPSASVQVGDLANTVLPTVSGTVAVGAKLTADEGTWSAQPDSFTYRWFQSGSTAVIGTGKTLDVPSTAIGHTVKVEVTAKKAGYVDAVAMSLPTAAAALGELTNTTKPTITGTAQVGQTLTVDPGTWSTTPSTVAFKWYANGVELKDVTGNRLTLAPGLVNKVIQVRVGAGVPGAIGMAWTDRTAPVAQGKLQVTGKPTLKGKAKVGKKLKVVLPVVVPAGATVKVQWLLGKQPIPGATKKSLKLSSKLYRGKKVRAVVAWTMPGYATVLLKTAKVTIK